MRRTLLVLLATTATALAVAPPAGAAEKAIWGPVTLPGGGSAFPVYRDLGVDTFHYVVNWQDVAPDRPADPGNPFDPAYHWPRELDEAVAAAAANGIDVALLLQQSPPWANGGRSALHVPDPGAFATFMAAASRRYPSVRRWMVWGEPNRSDRFQPNGVDSPEGPRAYAQILDTAYGALKSVSPENIVIGGMTWTGGDVKPASFMKLMRLPNGRPPRLDWYGHNPFPFRFPNLRELVVPGGYRDISDLDTFTRQLHQTYGPRARFWLSEYLVQSDRGSSQFEKSVSRPEQARWLSAAYDIADGLDSVAGLGWLSLMDQAERPGSANWGLLTADGQRKPAYDAYRSAPSERFKPRVRVRRRIPRRVLSRRGLPVRVRPVLGGRTVVKLSRRGKRVSRRAIRLRGRTTRRLRLRVRRPRNRRRYAHRGRYVLTVKAPRGTTRLPQFVGI